MHRVTISCTRSEPSNSKISFWWKNDGSGEGKKKKRATRKEQTQVFPCNWTRSMFPLPLLLIQFHPYKGTTSFEIKKKEERIIERKGTMREKKRRRREEELCWFVKKENHYAKRFHVCWLLIGGATLTKRRRTVEEWRGNVEERKWLAKWLESGLISMQNAEVARGARVTRCVLHLLDRQPYWPHCSAT